jgi:hypothetical protein
MVMPQEGRILNGVPGVPDVDIAESGVGRV